MPNFKLPSRKMLSKPLYSKAELQENFTCPSKKTILPEGVEVSSVHISLTTNSAGEHVVYNSDTNTELHATRAQLAALTQALNAGEHHEALCIKS